MAQTFSGINSFTDDIHLTALKKLFLDGGDNTYILESSADRIQLVCGGAVNTTFASTWAAPQTDWLIKAGKKLGFDGSITTNTYMEEDAADDLGLYVGGAQMMRFHETTVNGVVSHCVDNAVIADATLFNSGLTFYTADNGADMDLIAKYKDAGGVVRTLTLGTMT